MRLSKLDPQTLKQSLRQETISTDANQERVLNYFFMREFLTELLKKDEYLEVHGSFLQPAFTPEFRLPEDIDLTTYDYLTTNEIIKQLINDKIFGEKVDIKLNKDFGTYKKLYAKTENFKSVMNLHILLPKSFRRTSVEIPPVLSTDKPLAVRTDSYFPEKLLARAIKRSICDLSINDLYNKRIDDGISFKSLYDVFALSQSNKIDSSMVQKWILNDNFGVQYADLATIKSNIDKYIANVNLKKLWNDGEKERIATSTATPEKVITAVKDAVKEFNFER